MRQNDLLKHEVEASTYFSSLIMMMAGVMLHHCDAEQKEYDELHNKDVLAFSLLLSSRSD